MAKGPHGKDIDYDDRPRWQPESRKRFAIAKFYGIGDEEWTIEEIADYLRVKDSTVASYIFDSDMGTEVSKRLADVQAQTRLDVVMRLFDQLDTLDEIEEKLLSEKRPITTGYKPQTVSGVPDYSDESMHIEDAPEIEFTVPVADEMDEAPEIEQVKEVWKEKREIIQDIEDLLGLEEPEQMEVDSEHTEISMEKKVYEFEGDDDDTPLPEQDTQTLAEKYGDEE